MEQTTRLGAALLLAALAGRGVEAQTAARTASTNTSGAAPVARFSAAIAAGGAELASGQSEQALSGTLQYQPRSWLTFSATPTLIHASSQSTRGASLSSTGLGDLPLSGAVSTDVPMAWSPSVAAALEVVLPTGNAACGLGSGATSVGLDAGVTVSPTDPLHLSLDASHSLSGLSAQSALSTAQATWLSIEAAYDVTNRWTGSLSVGGDVGRTDSTQLLSRQIGAGASYSLKGPLALTFDGSHRLSGDSPLWAFSVGIGTASSPINATSPLRRLGRTFVGGVNRGSGAGKLGACR